MSSDRATYLALLFGSIAWCSLIVLAPVCAASTGFPADAAQLLYQFFHRICHQLDERTFHVLGKPFGVCIRCSAIYGSFLASIAIYPLVRPLHDIRLPSRAMIGLSLLPMVLDVVADVIGLHSSTMYTRLITGSAAGCIFAFVIVPAAVQGVRELIASHGSTPLQIQKGQVHV